MRGFLAALLLLATTGCGAIESVTGANPAPYTVDPSQPFVVVTVGGSPVATATPGVAETIPESTPLPRIALPTRDPADAPPVASPSLSRPNSSSSAGRLPPSQPRAAASPAAAAGRP